MRPAPTICPICQSELTIANLHCSSCDTTIEGNFVSGQFSNLTPEQLEFIFTFVRCEGKINRMEQEIGLSYPTIRNRLHETIRALGYEPGKDEAPEIEADIRSSAIADLEAGKITALSGLFVLASLHFALRWFHSGERRHWWGAQLVLVAALFTFELGLVIPALSTFLLWLLPGEKGSFFKRFGALAGVQWVVVGAYFLLNKIVLGAWVGHYGEAVHLRSVPAELAANFWRDTAKLGLFGRYLDLPVKQAVCGALDQPFWNWGLSGLLAAGLAIAWLLRKRLSVRLRLSVFFLTAFGLTLAPIIKCDCAPHRAGFRLPGDGARYPK